jgi:hypothetical protein
MRTKKLKLEKIEVETFETSEGEAEKGTVQAMETADVRTCWGQTAACTACPPRQCY